MSTIEISSRLVGNLFSRVKQFFVPADRERFLRYVNEVLFDITEDEIWEARGTRERGKN